MRIQPHSPQWNQVFLHNDDLAAVLEEAFRWLRQTYPKWEVYRLKQRIGHDQFDCRAVLSLVYQLNTCFSVESTRLHEDRRTYMVLTIRRKRYPRPFVYNPVRLKAEAAHGSLTDLIPAWLQTTAGDRDRLPTGR